MTLNEELTDPELEKQILTCTELLDQEPDNLELIKKIGFLFLHGNDPAQANDYLRKALELDPATRRSSWRLRKAQCSWDRSTRSMCAAEK